MNRAYITFNFTYGKQLPDKRLCSSPGHLLYLASADKFGNISAAVNQNQILMFKSVRKATQYAESLKKVFNINYNYQRYGVFYSDKMGNNFNCNCKDGYSVISYSINVVPI